jgi:hypothetical protein
MLNLTDMGLGVVLFRDGGSINGSQFTPADAWVLHHILSAVGEKLKTVPTVSTLVLMAS